MNAQTQSLLDIIVPILLQSTGLGGLFNQLGAIGSIGGVPGAATDYLAGVRAEQFKNAQRTMGMGTSQAEIAGGANAIVSTLGLSPNGMIGGGLSSAIQMLYNSVPQLRGSLSQIMGIRDATPFMQQVFNGAPGINYARNGYAPSVFDANGVIAAQTSAARMGRWMFENGRKENGDVDFSYTHGLNEQEQGLVAQRLMSSRIAYTRQTRDRNGVLQETGELDLDRDAADVKDNLKTWGEKLNRAASSLTKITGSVQESIALLDRMAGGDFLGGSAQDAEDVLRRAQGLSGMIRSNAASAGVDPREYLQIFQNTLNSFAAGLGLNGQSIGAGGADIGILPSMAITTMASQWDAEHPKASPTERARARMGFNQKMAQFVGSAGEKISTIAGGYADQLSNSEREAIKTALANGDTNTAVALVKRRLGASMVEDLMHDEGALQGIRMDLASKPSSEGTKLAQELYVSGAVGSSADLFISGRDRTTNMRRNQAIDTIASRTGVSSEDLFREQNAAARAEMIKFGEGLGIDRKVMESIEDIDELQRFISRETGDKKGVSDARTRGVVKTLADQAKGQTASTKGKTKNEKEQRAFSEKLRSDIVANVKNDAKRKDMLERLDRGDVRSVLMDYAGQRNMKEDELREYTGGQMLLDEGESIEALNQDLIETTRRVGENNPEDKKYFDKAREIVRNRATQAAMEQIYGKLRGGGRETAEGVQDFRRILAEKMKSGELKAAVQEEVVQSEAISGYLDESGIIKGSDEAARSTRLKVAEGARRRMLDDPKKTYQEALAEELDSLSEKEEDAGRKDQLSSAAKSVRGNGNTDKDLGERISRLRETKGNANLESIERDSMLKYLDQESRLGGSVGGLSDEDSERLRKRVVDRAQMMVAEKGMSYGEAYKAALEQEAKDAANKGNDRLSDTLRNAVSGLDEGKIVDATKETEERIAQSVTLSGGEFNENDPANRERIRRQAQLIHDEQTSNARGMTTAGLVNVNDATMGITAGRYNISAEEAANLLGEAAVDAGNGKDVVLTEASDSNSGQSFSRRLFGDTSSLSREQKVQMLEAQKSVEDAGKVLEAAGLSIYDKSGKRDKSGREKLLKLQKEISGLGTDSDEYKKRLEELSKIKDADGKEIGEKRAKMAMETIRHLGAAGVSIDAMFSSGALEKEIGKGGTVTAEGRKLFGLMSNDQNAILELFKDMAMKFMSWLADPKVTTSDQAKTDPQGG